MLLRRIDFASLPGQGFRKQLQETPRLAGRDCLSKFVIYSMTQTHTKKHYFQRMAQMR